uniref:Xylulose kinase-1 n=1 Tax=Tanacetum cinerariifolium TaxID=118510 RepID=A0A699JXS9_TANCI|nr:hypothetical protein [Tanacetum cinerariifolium]
MSSLFTDTHNMVAILAKSNAAEGFEQIIDFLSRSFIHYALTVNPHIYVSCIKQFWNTASVKHSDDVTRLQALVNRTKIVISEDVIREILQLDDAEGMVCLPNEEIFAVLAQMGYEKPSTKLNFYKAFFSSQKINFSKYIFDSLVRNVDSSSKFYMYPWFIQLIIQNQLGDLSTHTTRYISPALTQKVFANMRWIGKGFLGVETPLSEGMLADREITLEGIAEEQVQADDAVAAAVQETVVEDVANEAIPSTPTLLILPSPPSHDIPSSSQAQILDTCSALTRRVKNLEHDKAAQKLEIIKLKAKDVFNQGRMIDDLDKDEGIELVVDQVKDAETAENKGRHAAKQAEKQAEIYHLDLDHPSKVLSMQEDDSEVQEVVEVVTTAKLITEVVTVATSQVSAASATISAAKPSIPAVSPTVIAAYTRRRKVVIIRDPEEELSSKTLAETPKLKDKDKGILIETSKPIKEKDQIELDAEYARKLNEEINKDHEKINKDINWDAAIDHANKNLRRITMFDVNMRFLFKSREEMEEEDREVLKSINETPAQKAAKRRKLNEEAQEVEDLKKHLEVVNDEDDDVFTEATPLARKVPVVDYQIVLINNKPRFKIIIADGTH